MKNFFRITILLALIIANVSCNKDENLQSEQPEAPETPEKPVVVEMQDVSLHGLVHDSNGNPLSGVSVSTGTLTEITDSEGKFSFDKAGVVDKRAVISFEKSGYFTLTRSGVKDDEMFIDAMMYPKGNSDISLQTTFEVASGKELRIGGMKVDLSALSIVRADGSEYKGRVNADMLYLDPNNEHFTAMMPGGDLAAIREDNSEVMLISWGMTDVNLTDEEGKPLQLKNGAPADITFPIPEGMDDNPPPTIPLWSFNEDRGIWIEEGEASLQGNVYVGKVTHFSWVNLDVPAERVTIKGSVTDCEDRPLQFVKVTVGQTSAFTNIFGNYSVFVPENTPVTAVILSKDYHDYTPEKSYDIEGKPGGSVVTQDFSLPCIEGHVYYEIPEKLSIRYDTYAWLMSAVITYDNNGKRVREDMFGIVTIIDHIAKKKYQNVWGFGWSEEDYDPEEDLLRDIIAATDVQLLEEGYTKAPDEIIAGQTCTVFINESYRWKYAKWNGIIMYQFMTLWDDDMLMYDAIDVTTNVPEEAFTQVYEVTWI